MYPKIIALSGLMRSGKDTVANYLVANHNYHHIKFTDKLKKAMCIFFDITEEHIEKNKNNLIEIHEFQNAGITYRQFMQFFGTEMMQYKLMELVPEIDKTFWVKTLFTPVMQQCLINNSDYKIVISDLRFIHEYEFIREFCRENNLEYLIVNIQRDTILGDTGISQHISEKEIFEIPTDIIINNNYKTVKELYNNIDDKLMLSH